MVYEVQKKPFLIQIFPITAELWSVLHHPARGSSERIHKKSGQERK